MAPGAVPFFAGGDDRVFFCARRAYGGDGRRALLAALILLVSPPFWVHATSLMADVPLLGAWLASVALALHRDSLTSRQLYLGLVLATGAALFTAFSALALLPLLAVLLLYPGPSRPGWAALGSALAVFVLFYLAVWIKYGMLPIVAPHREFSINSEIAGGMALMQTKLIYLLTATGGTLFPLLAILIAARPKPTVYLLVMGTICAMMIQRALQPEDPRALEFILMLGAGIAVWAATTLHAWRAAPAGVGILPGPFDLRHFFLVWAWGMALAAVLVYPFGAVRYLLPAFAPLVLLALLPVHSVQTATNGALDRAKPAA